MMTDSEIVSVCARDERRPFDVAAASYGSDVMKMIADESLHGDVLMLQARVAFRMARLALGESTK